MHFDEKKMILMKILMSNKRTNQTEYFENGWLLYTVIIN